MPKRDYTSQEDDYQPERKQGWWHEYDRRVRESDREIAWLWKVGLTVLVGLLLFGWIASCDAKAAVIVGVSDNEISDTQWGRDQAQAMGLQAGRVYVNWHGQETADAESIELVRNAMRTGARVWVTVMAEYIGNPTANPGAYTPDTKAERWAYANFLVSLALETGAEDFTVWNEPNLGQFWGTTPNPRMYFKLLAVTYDALAPLGVRTWAFGLEHSRGTIAFYRDVSEAYKRSKRARPIFYGVNHHPYPRAGESFDTKHKGNLFTIGDTSRLIKTLNRNFKHTPQCGRKCRFPLMYGEGGWATEKMHIGQVTPAQQAAEIQGTVNFLSRFPRMIAFLNFQLRDDGEWTTGLFTESGQRKPAAGIFGA